MKTVSIQEAEENLSQLVDEAANGEPFVIAKAGKPLVTVVAVDEAATPEVTEPKKRRIGFLKGQISVPDDFDTVFAKEIEDMFHGDGK
ncbi:type II toxin-antitoxin system Phd/YefM family antitoxin [Neorhizobium sp. DAR64860/K0K1]|uniref:type II toxin-antitoxin system Phd/YefM family antitoxin n=1 Tax=Neorhizobium sp. DAR64860/K0K1 TaxID=3421955 RepID=UPI003D28EE28